MSKTSSVETRQNRRRLTPLESDLIVCLKEKPKSLGDLRTCIHARDTSVLHAIRSLEREKLINRDALNHSYSLTSIGRVQAVLLDQLLGASDTLRIMEDFWLNHDISGIPEHLLAGIRTLKDATVVRGTPSDLLAVHHKYVDLLKNSRTIHGVSPIFHPDFAEAMAQILESGAEVRLVVTKDVLDRIRHEVRLRDLARYVKRVIINRNLELHVTKDDLRIGLTVTEGLLSLGLFTLDGEYDYRVDMLSSDPHALEWGNQLFEYYRAKGKRIRFSSFI